jgi:hypothetical protein
MNLVQLIGNPTRVTQTSESLIDVILVTNFGIVENSEVLQSTISDHYIVTVQLNLKQERVKLGKIMTRSYKNYKADEFKKDIAEIPLNTVNILEDVSDNLDTFNGLFLEVLDKLAPVKTIKLKSKPCPFLTNEIKLLMKKKRFKAQNCSGNFS